MNFAGQGNNIQLVDEREEAGRQTDKEREEERLKRERENERKKERRGTGRQVLYVLLVQGEKRISYFTFRVLELRIHINASITHPSIQTVHYHGQLNGS